ncbi:MAG TPA: DMT family transporter [Rhabdochlamydiaceae bacterium]|jgi:drug/metabolite transporter (DMT)-like permease
MAELKDDSDRVPMHQQHIGRGVTFGILAAVSFTLMSLLGKIIGDKTSTDTILFARFAISLVLLLPWVIKNPKEALYAKNFLTIISRSFFTLVAFVFFFYALKFIPLANALLLNNTFPLFVPIIVWIIAKHRTSYKVWMGILLGFIGVGCVLRPASGFFQTASLIALASGILAAIAVVIIRRLTKTTPVIQILFYNYFICTLLTAVFLPFGWKSFDLQVFLLLLGVGLSGTAYQLFSTLSYAKTPVRITSPLMFLCIVFGVFADWLIWNKIPNIITLIGMLCVIAGGVITIYFGQREIMRK